MFRHRPVAVYMNTLRRGQNIAASREHVDIMSTYQHTLYLGPVYMEGGCPG